MPDSENLIATAAPSNGAERVEDAFKRTIQGDLALIARRLDLDTPVSHSVSVPVHFSKSS